MFILFKKLSAWIFLNSFFISFLFLIRIYMSRYALRIYFYKFLIKKNKKTWKYKNVIWRYMTSMPQFGCFRCMCYKNIFIVYFLFFCKFYVFLYFNMFKIISDSMTFKRIVRFKFCIWIWFQHSRLSRKQI